MEQKTVIEIGNRLSELAALHQLSDRQLALALGTTPSNICDWKHGRGKPSIDICLKASRRFFVSMEYIVTGKDSEPVMKINAAKAANEAEHHLLNTYRTLPERQQAMVSAYADGLAYPLLHERKAEA